VKVLSILSLIVLGLPSMSSGAGPAPADSDSEKQEVADELRSEEDPTILKRRAWLETEWNSFKDGSNNIEETLGGLWSWRLSPGQNWAVRIKVPYEVHVAGRMPGDSHASGLGDIKVAAGTAFRLGDTWRVGAGLELRTPTGTEPTLSDNVWRLQEFGAVAWDAAEFLTISPSFEYNESVAEEPDAAPQHFLEMFFPATVLLPAKWAATARYEAKVDYQSDNAWTHSAKFVVGKELNDLPLALMLSIEKPFDGGEKKFQVNFAATWFFRQQAKPAP
jgi:hypothetical protein